MELLKCIFLLLLLDMYAAEPAPKKMRNVGYLLAGYNLLDGDPLSEGLDPGFSSNKIFKATYDQEQVISDTRYTVPDHIDILMINVCSSDIHTQKINSETQFKNMLSTKVSTSVSGGNAIYQGAFSLSVGYEKTSNTLRQNEKSIFLSELKCQVYKGSVKKNPSPQFEENFLNVLYALNTEEPDYFSFINRFGTHYIQEAIMGSSYTRSQTMTKSNVEKMKAESIDVKMAASASVANKLKVEVSSEVKKEDSSSSKFSEEVEDTKVYTVGAVYEADQSLADWQKNSFDHNLPVKIKLASIIDLLQFGHFQNEQDEEKKKAIESIKDGLATYLKEYCMKYAKSKGKSVEICKGPKEGCGGGTDCSVNADCLESQGDKKVYKCKCKNQFIDAYPDEPGTICIRPTVKTETLTHPSTKGTWGTWGEWQFCPDGLFANRIQLSYHPTRGDQDDRGMTGICLTCTGVRTTKQICSKYDHSYGLSRWTEEDKLKCPQGSYLFGWRQNVEPYRDDQDDTALDNVDYKCRADRSNGKESILQGQLSQWGSWSRYKNCQRGQFICGLRTRVETYDSDDDVTGLNDIQHRCCKRANN